jgi:hypothetical protein
VHWTVFQTEKHISETGSVPNFLFSPQGRTRSSFRNVMFCSVYETTHKVHKPNNTKSFVSDKIMKHETYFKISSHNLSLRLNENGHVTYRFALLPTYYNLEGKYKYIHLCYPCTLVVIREKECFAFVQNND